MRIYKNLTRPAIIPRKPLIKHELSGEVFDQSLLVACGHSIRVIEQVLMLLGVIVLEQLRQGS